MKLTFGKHKGKTVAWIKKNDENYYNWGLENIPNIFNKPKKEKKEKEIELSEEPIKKIHDFNYNFIWHDSYPKDMHERMLKHWNK